MVVQTLMFLMTDTVQNFLLFGFLNHSYISNLIIFLFTVPDYDFATVHKKPIPFNTIRTNCWIPGKDIEVKVIAAERVDATTKLFNPNL